MAPPCCHPTLFISEDAARTYLEQLLEPYFKLVPEVRIKVGDNRLRIDYVALPRPGNDFQFTHCGIEVKRGFSEGKEYLAALKQSADYVDANIDDPRAKKFHGRRLDNVYLWPGMPEAWSPYGDNGPNMFWVTRAYGRHHVGLIYETKHQGPYFAMCADRQWSAGEGARRAPHNTRNLIGNGTERR
jgi:hypothetical protein